MTTGIAPKIRLVRCPKCRKLLPELADVPVYKCGGCDAILIAKNRRNEVKSAASGLCETATSESSKSDQVSGDKITSSCDKALVLSSGECPTGQENGREDGQFSEEREPNHASHEDECSLGQENETYQNKSRELDQVSGDVESGTPSDKAILPSSGECSLDQENESDRSTSKELGRFSDHVEASGSSHPSSAEWSTDQEDERNKNQSRESDQLSDDVESMGASPKSILPSSGECSVLDRENGIDQNMSNELDQFSADVESRAPHEAILHSSSECSLDQDGMDRYVPKKLDQFSEGLEYSGASHKEILPSPGECLDQFSKDVESHASHEAILHSSCECSSDQEGRMDQFSEDVEPTGANHKAILPSLGERLLDRENGTDQNLSTEDPKIRRSDQNDSEDRNMEHVEVPNLVVKFAGENSALAEEKLGVDVVNERDCNSRRLRNKKPVDAFILSTDEQLKQPQRNSYRGFDRLMSKDTYESADFMSPSSELSALDYMSKSPTTRSSHAYDGSISSFDGVDDQFPNRNMSSFVNTYKANIVVSEERPRWDKFVANSLINSESEMTNRASDSSWFSSDTKKFSMKPTRSGRQVRDWTRTEREEYTTRAPPYQRGFPGGYERGSPSSQIHDEFLSSSSSLHSLNKPKYMEQDKLTLLRMVYELQDQLDRTLYFNGKANERHMPGYYSRQFPHEEIHHDVNYPIYPGRFNRFQQHKSPFSGETTINSTHQYWQHSTQLATQLLSCNNRFCGVHPGRSCHSCSSFPSSPQRYTDSEFWGRETKSEDLRRRDLTTKRNLREKHHLAKRHFRPIAGGAPFITCTSCFKPLQLPADFLVFKRRCHRLKCGACFRVLKFTLQDKTHIVPYTRESAIDTALSEVKNYSDVVHKRNVSLASQVNGNSHADPVSQSDDYGDSICMSYSTYRNPDLVGPLRTSRASTGQRGTSSSSLESMYRSKNHDMSKLAEASAEVEHQSRATGSPLHRLMGYSSPSQVINGPVESG